MFNFQGTVSRIQESIKNITLITLIQILLMILFTTISFLFPKTFQSFSPIQSSKNFSSNILWIILHYYLHSNLLHLLLNSITLIIFGSAIEKRIGSTQYILFFIIHSILEPLIMISLYTLHLSEGNPVLGMSGFIFALMLVYYYQPHYYQDLLFCFTINIISFIVSLLIGERVSFLGHSTGILTGFLFTREFFSWIFKSPLFTLIENLMKKIFGKISLFVAFDSEKELNNQSHLEIMHEIKSDLKNLFGKCKKSSENDSSLPI